MPVQQKATEPSTEIKLEEKTGTVVEKAEEKKAETLKEPTRSEQADAKPQQTKASSEVATEPKEDKNAVSVPDPSVSKPAKVEETLNANPVDNQPANLLRDPFVEAVKESKPATVEKKPLIVVDDPIKIDDKAPKTRDLFEPVIISVPRSISQKTVEKADQEQPKKLSDEAIAAGTTRRRVIEGKEIKSDQQCSIDISQENISLLNGGGSLGILVSISGDGQTKDVTASTASPDDIEVKAEPEINGISGRRFYVIKSVSANTGVYQVNFESPCGKKEITVRVR